MARASDTDRQKTGQKDVRALETAFKKAMFLKEFAIIGEIGPTARAVGIHRDTHYGWLKADSQYAKDFEEAQLLRVEVLEAEVRRRAIDGYDEPVFYQGKKVCDVRKFSDTLLIFALNGEKPDKYKKRHEHTGPGGGPISLSALPDQELDDRITALERQLKA